MANDAASSSGTELPGHTFDVSAARMWNDTGLLLHAGMTYELRAEGRWRDWWLECAPDGHPGRNFVFRLAARCKRCPSAPWFALIGCLDHDLDTHVVIGTGATFAPPRDGRLTCFANDMRFMYWNNKGTVRLTVGRTPA